MSTLKELLKDAPVEWKDLDEICNIVRGVTYNKSLEVSENGLKILRANNISVKHSELNFNDIKQIALEAKVKSDQKLYKNDILISVASGSKEHVGKVAFIYENIDYYFGGFMAVIRTSDIILPKYVFQILKSKYFSEFLDATLESSTINNLSNGVLKKFQIPIPYPNNPEKSLEIQQEIVRVLDGLSEQNKALTSALAHEIAQRKKQYEFYREALFRFEGTEVEWKTLGDTEYFKILSGGTPSKAKIEYWENGTIPWLRSESCNNSTIDKSNDFITDIGLKNSSAKLLEPFSTLIALVGATIFKTGYLQFEASTNQNIASIKSLNNEFVKDKYLFIYITSLYQELKRKMKDYGMLNLTTLRSFEIPVPSIQEQERIVRLLDQFDEATKNIVAQLEKEIELRNKQYNYYRDHLLTFPKV